MDYGKKVELRLFINMFILIIGICAFLTGLYLALNAGQNSSALGIGYLCSTGAALVGISVIKIGKKLSLLNDKNKLKEDKIEKQDERNLILAYKASHYSLLFTCSILYVMSFVYAFIDMNVVNLLAAIICVLGFTRYILYFTMRKLV